MTLVLTPGQCHESTVFEDLLTHGAVKRRYGGRPRLRPHRIVGDKGYSYPHLRRLARRRGIRITIPHRKNQRRGRFDKTIYRQRNRIERLINRLKQFRRLATRYEKRAVNHRTMWIIAATILWL